MVGTECTHQPIPAIRPPVSADHKLLATGNLIRGLVVLSPNQNELQEMSLEGEVQLLEQVWQVGTKEILVSRYAGISCS